MATVTGLTAEKAIDNDEQSLTSAVVDPSTGRLLFTRMDGAVIDAGLVRGSTARKWDRSTTYTGGDLVFYAGRAYRALNSNSNKVPGLESTNWVLVGGAPADVMIETDPTFERSSFAEQWETFWKTGSTPPTVSYTTVAGEFDSGRRALKVSLPPSSSQRLYQKEENLIAGGELIILRVRAKKLAAGTGTQFNATLMQNDTTGPPEPLASGAVYVSADVSNVQPTTSWGTYEFRFIAANSKPRGVISIQVEQDSTGSSNVVFDSIRIYRGKKNEDSGWITAAPSSGLTGEIRYRRYMGQLFIAMDVKLAATLTVGADGNFTDITAFILPPGFRPAGSSPALSIEVPFTIGAAAVNVTFKIYAGGTVSLAQADARNVSYTIATTTAIQGMSPGILINS